ncbi:helix-turn-helix transcriptional regulator [Caulobacter sp. S45]|uniref:helix-turn-helix domain-containing protein n=1 Tax=Caulobacter sp. S45 TaxID=1641861 RepID=UPI00131AA955|nr:helix-turn-helix transcriptional regulator [Caulobacter sp. S45]
MRRARGLNQAALGDRLQITFQQIQKYERGTNRRLDAGENSGSVECPRRRPVAQIRCAEPAR